MSNSATGEGCSVIGSGHRAQEEAMFDAKVEMQMAQNHQEEMRAARQRDAWGGQVAQAKRREAPVVTRARRVVQAVITTLVGLLGKV